jgi:ankyrin repeat protein
MISEPAKVFPQLPPKWDSWIEALKLLLYHGASVHEAVGERTLSMLNINHRFGEEKTMEFFNVLVAEGYTYWETTHKAGWSAVLTAIRTRQDSLRALWLLKRTGTDIARILSDGRSPLHLAAELADDASILEYLYDAGCSKDLNRQDMWGWTPLHYGIAAAAINPSCPKSLEKINFFLDKGAYLDIKGRKRPLLTSDTMTTDEFTPGQLCKALKPSLHSKLVDMARAAGREEAGLE